MVDNSISKAARLKKDIATTYEADYEYSLAYKYFSEAAELFEADGNYVSDVNKSYLKMVEINAFMPDLDISNDIKLLELVADKYCENKMTEPSAKNLYF